MRSLILLLALPVSLLVACSSGGDHADHGTSTSVMNDEVVADATVDLRIDGMTCIKGCVGAINAKMAKTAGVKSCDIDFEAGKATIAYDSEVTSPDDLIATIGRIADGAYTATPWTDEVETEAAGTEDQTTDEAEAVEVLLTQ